MTAEEHVLSLCHQHFGQGIPGAAVMGNIAVETGYSFDYQQRQHGGGPGRGLFQMEGTMWADYEAFLKKNGAVDSAESQVLYAADQVNSGGHIGAGNAKKIRTAFASGDIVAATKAFCDCFERPSVPHLDQRVAAAKKYL